MSGDLAHGEEWLIRDAPEQEMKGIPHEELVRYSFQRPHTGIAREPIRGPAVWEKRLEFEEWTPDERDDLQELGAAILARKEAFTPHLDHLVAHLRVGLQLGSGYVLLRGMPAAEWGETLAVACFWGLIHRLGRPAQLRPEAGLMDAVYDRHDPELHGYQGHEAEGFHSGFGDVLGLLCLRPAPEGGTNRLVSSGAVYNELLARRPDWIDRLYSPWGTLVPCHHAAGRLATFYHFAYLREQARGWEHDLLDLYEAIAEDLKIEFTLGSGDFAFIHNPTVLHSRTAFADNPDSPRKMFRVFLVL